MATSDSHCPPCQGTFGPLLLGLLLLVVPTAAHAQASWSFPLPATGREVGIIKPHPWSGWWWPWRGSPLAKVLTRYDAFVQKRTGRNPGAAAWERKHHRGGEDWAGHCNGWSAAAALEPEPRAPRTVDGMEFTVADQKGLLTEQYMDCYHTFYGTRSYGAKADPDILPHHFHRLLLEYVKERQVPIVLDTDGGSPVWNFPVYAFETTWTTDARRGLAAVTTKVYLANDDVKADFVGTAGFVKTYRYTLELNAAGEVTGGTWDKGFGGKKHPDFVWVPTADAPPAGWQNPAVDPAMVRAIVGGPAPEPPPPSTPAPPPAASGPARILALVEEAPAGTGTDVGPEAAAEAQRGAPLAAFDEVLREAGLTPETLFP